MSLNKQTLILCITFSCLLSVSFAMYSKVYGPYPTEVIKQPYFKVLFTHTFEAYYRTNYTAGPGPLVITSENSLDNTYHFEMFALNVECYTAMKIQTTVFSFYSFFI